ncbi:armadillo-type protein [Lipomyces japonicus]|uniref:armadillo-type protein n=1 Tax=Lipomyces japonicus TaxID=56871 RepID=UPI0034CD0E2E
MSNQDDHHVLELLIATQSSEQDARTNAEARIASLQQSNGDELSKSLIRVTINHENDLSVKQSALVILKLTISTTWSIQFDAFKGNPLQQSTKSFIRSSLFQILLLPERKLRSLAANIISKISSADFPDEWPDLFDHVMSLLQSEIEDNIEGAVIILKELLDDGFTLEQFASIATSVFDALYNIATSEKIGFITKASTVEAVRFALNFFNQVEADKTDLNAFIAHAIDSWSTVFSEFLKLEYTEENRTNGLVLLKYHSVKAMEQLENTFPTESQSAIYQRLFPSVWADFPKSSEIYGSVFLNLDSDDGLADPEGEPGFVKLLVTEELEFLRLIIPKHQIKLFFKDSSDNMRKLVEITTFLAQISTEDEDDWKEDGNSFVTEELSLSSKYTCRSSSSDFVLELGEHLLDSLIDSLKEKLLSLVGTDRWRLLESVLFLLESVLVQDRNYGRQFGQNATLESLFQIISSGVSSGNEFLRARSFIFGGTIARNLKDFLVPIGVFDNLFDSALQSASSDSSFIVRCCALLSLQRFLAVSPRKHSKVTQMAIVEAVASIISSASDETPSLLVDALDWAVKISPDLAIVSSSRVIELLFTAAAIDASNIQLTSDTFEAFEYLSEHTKPEHYQAFCETAIPPLMQGLGTSALENIPNSSLIVNLLSILVDHAPRPLPRGLVDFVFPKVAHLLLQSEDNQFLQYGSEFMAHVIQHDPDQLLAFRSDDDKSGLEIVLNIVARLLNPEVEESSAICIGEVVTEVVDKYGRDLGDLLGQLLMATAQRLVTAQNPTFVQNLILVFAHMVSIDAQGVVNFLSEINLSTGTGLSVVLKAWLANFGVFRGFKEIRLNALALAKLYLLHDARIEETIVDGDLIIDNSNVIKTRSRARNQPLKYTSIPANVKIVKLFVDDLKNIPDSAGPNRTAWQHRKSIVEEGSAIAASAATMIDDNDGNKSDIGNEVGGGGENEDWEDVFNPADFGMTMSELKKLARTESFDNGGKDKWANEDDEQDDDDDEYDDEDEDEASNFFGEKGGDEETNQILVNFFKNIYANEREQIQSIYLKYLTAVEKQVLQNWAPRLE